MSIPRLPLTWLSLWLFGCPDVDGAAGKAGGTASDHDSANPNASADSGVAGDRGDDTDNTDDTDDADDTSGVDADGDGHFSIASGGEDCDDHDPDATIRSADQDCDGTPTEDDCDDTDSALNQRDWDEDGSSTCDGDCDDEDPRMHPGAADGFFVDWSCDGVLSPASTLAQAEVRFNGEGPGDQAGYSVSSAGDVDGDGLADILVGAPFDDEASTRGHAAYLILATSLGADAAIDLRNADYIFIREHTEDRAGMSVASAGDVDGDGRDDILIGAPFDPTGGPMSGSVYVVLGASLGTLRHIDLANADYKLTSAGPTTYAGTSVAGAGDVDGDGRDDILVGAPRARAWSGAAYLLRGSSLGADSLINLSEADYTFRGEATGDYAGISVAAAGDIDGDGLGDILLGAAHHDAGGVGAGSAYLIRGASLGPGTLFDLATADHKLIGETEQDATGLHVAGAGDVDGDGFDDVLVGSDTDGALYGRTGSAYVVTMATLGGAASFDLSRADHQLLGEHSLDHAGYSSTSLGDLDGDGTAEILVGAFSNNAGGSQAGTAYLFSGPSLSSPVRELTSADLLILGEGRDDNAGRSVANAGDVNGDGLDDILIGAPTDSDSGGGDRAGSAYLILTGR